MVKAITGDVVDVFVDQTDPEIHELRATVRRLEREASDARLEAARAREDANRAMATLRRTLSPLYQALKMVFGEFEAAGVVDTGAEPGRPTADLGKWDQWKQTLGTNCARVIDVLLLADELTIQGIATTAKMGKRQVYEATAKMGQAGIVSRNGSKFSLKKG